MSLLERLGRGHLSDATLARLWTDGLDSPDGGALPHPHLDACAACRARAAALDQWMDGVADSLRDEADAILTPERLAAQQSQIARRLEAIDRPTRVLAFPKAAHAVIQGHSNVRRWVTVAAAACLIAGFGLGQVFPLRQAIQQQATAPKPLTQQKAAERATEIAPASAPANDDDLMLSDAFARSHVQTLNALDDMTPHARDTVLNRRNKQYK